MSREKLFVLAVAVVALAVVLGGCPSKQQPVANAPVPPAAEGPGAAPGPGNQPPAANAPEGTAPAGALTKDQVKNFMASMEDKKLTAEMDKLAKAAGAKTDVKTADAATLKKVFDAAAKSPDMDKVVQAHGFANAGEWVNTAKLVFPGMGHAMALAMAASMGVKEGTPQFDKMVKESELGDMGEAFTKPTAEEQKTIDEAFAELMKDKMGAAKKAQ